jgi:hypothetical protein
VGLSHKQAKILLTLIQEMRARLAVCIMHGDAAEQKTYEEMTHVLSEAEPLLHHAIASSTPTVDAPQTLLRLAALLYWLYWWLVPARGGRQTLRNIAR